MAIKFIQRAPVIRRTAQSISDALLSYKRGAVTLTEAQAFIEKKSRKFAEPSKAELEEMRKAWAKYAPDKAKGLYLR